MTSPRMNMLVSLLAVAFAAGAQAASAKTYIVQLGDAPAATYTGSVSGLAATAPAKGAKLDSRAPNVQAYVNFLSTRRASTLAKVGIAQPMHQYSIVFNGFSAQLTDAQVQTLKNTAGVVSVTESQLVKADTTSTPGFLGINKPGGLWAQLDAASRNVKGEDIIIGVIDTGVWPESAAFSDKVDGSGKPVAYHQAGTQVYGPPPVGKWKGTCVAGPGFVPLTMCNNKLIGARSYGAAWLAGAAASGGGYTLHPSMEYQSARDGAGHGSHTASTAGGNSNVDATVDGAPAGVISGIAPRARIAVYKALWTASDTALGPGNNHDGGQTADILLAIDQAVADGVDVINYSVSGTQTNLSDPVEIAFLNATAANVFVAASAGNSGPGNQVAHISPWVTTVAASTHDRQMVALLTLGNGSTFTGPSVNTTGVPSAAMVLSSAIPAAGKTVADANLCKLGSLDTAAAVGKIVVCDRGDNARVEKSLEVKRVGGVGMVLINPTANSLVADFHSVPTVHLQNTDRSAVRSYVAAGAGTGSIGVSYNTPGAIAPVMASFSSRGPNKANGNILKPDITGPGVDIIANYIASLTQAEHDSLALGTYTPPANAASLQGTSMSSPHVAGAAALLKQLYPTWSPAAIKSAMMTTTTGVKLANGAADADRWGYGAGHMNPNGSANPGLVYDASPADYGRFLCGVGRTPPVGVGTCADLGAISPWNLNLASLTASDVVGAITFTRKVTNVTNATVTFSASTYLPGWNVVVSPASLTIAPGASASFAATITRTTAAAGVWTFGSLTWSDSTRSVTSPLSARALSFSGPATVSDTRVSGSGSKSFTITSGSTGPFSVVPTGLVAATVSNGQVGDSQTQCFNVTVPVGALLARFQLFDADTQGGAATDIDLDVFDGPNGTGSKVGASGSGTSDELVQLNAPATGTYSACAVGYATHGLPGGAMYKLSSWVVGPAVGVQTLKAFGPSSVTAGGTGTVGLSWAVPAGHRYLGALQYKVSGNPVGGTTTVFVDNH